MSTTLNLSGANTEFQFGVCCTGVGSGALSATSYSSGTTTVTITGAGAGTNLVAGNMAWIQQCDTGWTGSGLNAGTSAPNCTSGSYVDPGTIWICGVDVIVCSQNNTPAGTHDYELQNVLITNVVNNGGGSFTVTFTPGLYMSNWSSNNNALMIWQSQSNWSFGMGVEAMTVSFAFNANERFDLQDTYGSWVKGVRIIGVSSNPIIAPGLGGHRLFANNYVFGENPNNLASFISEPVVLSANSDDLFQNNAITGGIPIWGGGMRMGNVLAYNYGRDTETDFYISVLLDHYPFHAFELAEGNQVPQGHDDYTHGTHGISTWFRNYFQGWDNPYVTQNPWAFSEDAFNRFDNFIANAIGGSKTPTYSGTSPSGATEYVFVATDTLRDAGFMRWGNCDVVNASCLFNSGDVPTSTVMPAGTFPNATAFQNAVPANHNMPCSMFMPTYTGTNCTILPSGGTGLSWWKVCKSWTTFPTSCASFQTQPFPPTGPDQSGGPYVSGFSYDIPAAIAHTYLPIDTTLQNSFTITASSWSNNAVTCGITSGVSSGTAPCEILTVSLASINNGSAEHIIGGFQLSGVNASCIPAGINFANLYGNNELLMTGSNTTQIAYSLGTGSPDNGSSNQCTGTLKFPDVRQFDERVFQTDSSSSITSRAPLPFFAHNRKPPIPRGEL